MTEVIIGSRESKLAVLQSEMVKQQEILFWTVPWIRWAEKDCL